MLIMQCEQRTLFYTTALLWYGPNKNQLMLCFLSPHLNLSCVVGCSMSRLALRLVSFSMMLWYELRWAEVRTWAEWKRCKVMREDRRRWLQDSRDEGGQADGETDGAEEEDKTICSWSISLLLESSMETAGEEKAWCHHTLVGSAC